MVSPCCNCPFVDTQLIANNCNAGFALFMSLVEMLILSRCDIADPCGRLGVDAATNPPEDEYDFIVVGAGVAGPVVASRLSEARLDGGLPWSVLLLEAGPEEPTATQIPAYAVVGVGTYVDWNYTTVEQKNACLSTGGICHWPRGKMVAGTGGMQGMMYTRGNKRLYDSWGIEGWTYKDILPYFKRSENNLNKNLLDDGYHGFAGPLKVGQFSSHPLLSEVLLEAGRELGYYTQDVNGKNQTGFAIAQMMSAHGLRSSTPRAYLRPHKDRTNLRVAINAHVTKVLFENQRAVGVEYEDSHGKMKRVSAKKEVVLSAGAVGSPQLLLLSGVGPREHLEEMGIPVVLDSPGVGKNLHNHVSVGVGFSINESSYQTLNLEAVKMYTEEQKGPMASTGLTQNTAFLLSKFAERDYPDLQVFFDGYLAACSKTGQISECSGGEIENCGRRSIFARPTNILTESKGYLQLRSSNPHDYPFIEPQYLSVEKDVDVLVEGIKIILNLTNTEAMSRWDFKLDQKVAEGCENEEFASDAYWRCVVRRYTGPENHQGGTVKMGRDDDPEAVLDSMLRVRGLENLRVVDASVFPRMPNSNPIATIIMTAERVLGTCLAPNLDFATCIYLQLIANITASYLKLSDTSKYPRDTTDVLDEYDFIVVGAGSAGSVLANRLTERQDWKVLLVEAGDDPPATSEVPFLHQFLQNTEADWAFRTEPQEHACGAMVSRICRWPRGKMLGGTSSANDMLYLRGNKKDYDRWSEEGNHGWSYEDLLPYFKKSEKLQVSYIDNNTYHGREGPLTINYFKAIPEQLVSVIVDAIQEIGGFNFDSNGQKQSGFTLLQGLVEGGRRLSTATAFLAPIKNRKNLHVLKKALATKVLFENKKAVGLQYIKDGVMFQVRARKEVILSAGAVNTPKLLMLSGIGPADHLQDLGIPIVKDSPVGYNLQDHILVLAPTIRFYFEEDPKMPRRKKICETERGLRYKWNEMVQFPASMYFTASQYHIARSERWSGIGGRPLTGFISSKYGDETIDYPDLRLQLLDFEHGDVDYTKRFAQNMGLKEEAMDSIFGSLVVHDFMILSPTLMRPKSRGRITLKSKEPTVPPIIQPNYLSEKEDRDILLEGIKFAINFTIGTKAMDKLQTCLFMDNYPACDYPFGSDEYWHCIIEHFSVPSHNPSGTAKMGPDTDKGSVVDSRLRVKGVDSLRVADASIMPNIVTGNTDVATIMIGEKAADLIKQDYPAKN
ncbi:hypothetical protein J437_LFUL002602 [Ladona fulva]|uniref:Glucose-methanol-choline oxidoreductase N-terminal domain-containing protein n=1 Tax=Ladona fulva TaxID=123851 RepID=A0A8K0JUK3_LADFU|nr:hypothetical protein J437_LFUL002602 [Ladona fulva]